MNIFDRAPTADIYELHVMSWCLMIVKQYFFREHVSLWLFFSLQGEGPADHSGEGAGGGEGETGGERGDQSGGGTTAANLAVTSLLLSLTNVADPESRIRDPVPFRPLDPGSGIGKKSWSGFGMNNTDHISESLETIFWVNIHEFFDADPGWKKFGSGIWHGKNSDPVSGINIPDPQHFY
jgi:hypothetical protein